ncbi:hypothetical protein K7Z75_18460 [Mycobacterium avium subsp. hominissuis]|uniref:hypothetical protein n=1 Tax=Mycobacterium avium TaxID=1764 RepID=UPI00293AA2EA|nr:hypothetical protein [Mycobacterium avium]MDV3305646.1 hypothetical protein [Mycobacterium avium subsp. hominissuis]
MADEAPRVGTPEYEVLKYQRVAAGLNNAFGAEARVALVASFEGDGDTVDVCDVLQRAADYFKQHPELNVANAAWQTTVDMDGMVGFALELEVVPPAYYEEDIPIK